MIGDLKEIFAPLNLDKALGRASSPTSRVSAGPGAAPSPASPGDLLWSYDSAFVFPCQFFCRPALPPPRSPTEKVLSCLFLKGLWAPGQPALTL